MCMYYVLLLLMSVLLKYPDVFSVCALTRSMAKSADIVKSDEVDLCKTFMVNPEFTKLSSVVLQEKNKFDLLE